MAKFSVGDKVRVLTEAEILNKFGVISLSVTSIRGGWAHDMRSLLGKQVEVQDVLYGGGAYSLVDSTHLWDSQLLSHISDYDSSPYLLTQLLTDKSVGVKCSTEEEARILLAWAEQKGLDWTSGDIRCHKKHVFMIALGEIYTFPLKFPGNIIIIPGNIVVSSINTSLEPPISKTKGNTMKEAVKTQIGKNKEVAIMVARVTAGKTVNKKVLKMITPKLPVFIRGYAKKPLASVVLANIVGMAIKNYAPDNARANQLADVMLEAAAFEAVDAFDIDGIIETLLDGIDIPGFVEDE